MLGADAHSDTLDCGVDLVLNTNRQKYWIVAAKPLMKFHIKFRVTCSGFTCTEPFHFIGDLPLESFQQFVLSMTLGWMLLDFLGRFSPTVSDPVKIYVSFCLYVYESMSFRGCHIFT